MVDFYYTEGSIPCRFVQLLAKNLNINLNLICFDLLNQKDQFKINFLKINPQHCVPLIIDDGFILWESSAIAIYFVQKFSKRDDLYPKELQKRAIVDRALYFNMTVLRQRHFECYFPILTGTGIPGSDKLERLKEAYEILEAMLGANEYVAGEKLTIADYGMGTTVSTSVTAGFDLSPYKNVSIWFNKIKSCIPNFEEFNGTDVIIKIFENYRNHK